MNTERSNFTNKTFPVNNHNQGVVHRSPEAPVVETKELYVSILVVSNKKPCIFADAFSTIKQVRITVPKNRKEPERTIKVFEVTSLVKKPLTPVFETSVRGGRIYGGGTSTEALGRAKRKSRLTANHNHNGNK